MTALVVVMNREGVALAGDSATTIGEGKKIFNTGNKLFTLSPNYDVGVMIYNNAAFMGVPWEIIINKYRVQLQQNDGRFATLREYGENFAHYLQKCSNSIFGSEEQRKTFSLTVNGLMKEMTGEIWEEIKRNIYENAAPVAEEKISEIVGRAISNYHGFFISKNLLYSEEETARLADCIDREYGQLLLSHIQANFDKLPLSDDNVSKLGELCKALFLRDGKLPYHSGVVFAGFGTEELFPTCLSIRFENIICDRLKHIRETDLKVDDEIGAWIIPFAQQDVVQNFVAGVHPYYEEQLEHHLTEALGEEFCKEILDTVDGLTTEQTEALSATIRTVSAKRIRAGLTLVQQDLKKEHIDPIMDTVAALPKDELADMAENLVSITSFMRRVTMVAESVGGPIDVAVISKKDGFVWLKRKHYFDAEHNPHFIARYGRHGGRHGE